MNDKDKQTALLSLDIYFIDAGDVSTDHPLASPGCPLGRINVYKSIECPPVIHGAPMVFSIVGYAQPIESTEADAYDEGRTIGIKLKPAFVRVPRSELKDKLNKLYALSVKQACMAEVYFAKEMEHLLPWR